MLFGNCSKNIPAQIEVDGVDIERVHENRFLGVITDDKLNWKAHVKHIQNKLSRSISVLSKAKHFLDHKSLHILYCSLILPYLYYCAEVWGNTYKCTIQSLSILQKRAIRIVHNTGYTDHTNSLFLKSKTLKFIDLVDFQTAQIMYKAKNNLLPGNIQKLFFNRDGDYNLRGELNLKHQRARTTLKCFSVSVCGVRLWNGLGVELKQCPSITQFKKRYKHMVFNRYKREEGL